jgi:hypothetical protein
MVWDDRGSFIILALFLIIRTQILLIIRLQVLDRGGNSAKEESQSWAFLKEELNSGFSKSLLKRSFLEIMANTENSYDQTKENSVKDYKSKSSGHCQKSSRDELPFGPKMHIRSAEMRIFWVSLLVSIHKSFKATPSPLEWNKTNYCLNS